MDRHDHAHKFDPAHAARLDDPARQAVMPTGPLVAALGLAAGDRVADVGCGTGYWLRALMEQAPTGTRFWALDTEPAMLGLLRDRLHDHPRRDDVTLAPSTEHALPLPDASVTVVVLGAVYHELADRQAFLAEIRRVLAPGGRLALVDWDALAPGDERVAGPPTEERVPAATARDEVRAAGFAEAALLEGYRQSYALVTRRP